MFPVDKYKAKGEAVMGGDGKTRGRASASLESPVSVGPTGPGAAKAGRLSLSSSTIVSSMVVA
jgi:hypothetical protein